MSNAYNLINQHFNRLTVLEKTEQRKNGGVVWKCQCDCGNYTYVTSHDLVKNRVQSCGCLAKEKLGQLNYKDITNQKFGRLTAIYRTNKKGTNGQYYWYCECECGNTKIVRGDSLRNGSIQSCGCLLNERNSKDLTDQVIGFLRFIKLTDKKYKHYNIWECECLACHNICYISTHALSQGKRSCGCISRSIGEAKVAHLLQLHNIPYISEYTQHNCRYKSTNALARFDFYIPSENYIIEYDGRQHLIQGESVYDNPLKFQETRSHDQQKECWCKENKIPLIRIPYWHLDELTIDDLLLDKTKFLL